MIRKKPLERGFFILFHMLFGAGAYLSFLSVCYIYCTEGVQCCVLSCRYPLIMVQKVVVFNVVQVGSIETCINYPFDV